MNLFDVLEMLIDWMAATSSTDITLALRNQQLASCINYNETQRLCWVSLRYTQPTLVTLATLAYLVIHRNLNNKLSTLS